MDKREILLRMLFALLAVVSLIYGIMGMQSAQLYWGEDTMPGLFFLFISMTITFVGFFGSAFTAGLRHDWFVSPKRAVKTENSEEGK